MSTYSKPEARLKKFIKPQKLKAFFHKAVPLLPECCTLCAYSDNTLYYHSGKVKPSLENVIHVPVRNPSGEDFKIGVCYSTHEISSETDRGQIRSILEFLSFSIESHIEAESSRRLLGEETLSKYRELALLHRSIVALNNSLELKDVIKALVQEFITSALPAEMGAVYLPEEDGFNMFDSFGSVEPDTFSGFVRSSLFYDIYSSMHGEIINDTKRDNRCSRIPAIEIRSLLIMPIPSPNGCEGVLILSSRRAGVFNAAHLKHVATLASVAGISISNAYNFESIRVLMDALLKALAEAIDARDPYTAGHSERVAYLAVSFSRIISEEKTYFGNKTFTDEQLREIYYSGILHDIGKIGIKEEVLTKSTRLPDSIIDIIGMRMKLFGDHLEKEWAENFDRLKKINVSLRPSQDDLDFIHRISGVKFDLNGSTIHMIQPDEQICLLVPKGNLTPEERTEIERHPAESRRILEHIPFHEDLSQLLTIIGQHHERIDGSGYPSGISGNDILIQSQIIAIADIYDAVTQKRHYKPATSRGRALEILWKEAGQGKLDIDLVKLFVDRIDDIEKGADAINPDRPLSSVFCEIAVEN